MASLLEQILFGDWARRGLLSWGSQNPLNAVEAMPAAGAPGHGPSIPTALNKIREVSPLGRAQEHYRKYPPSVLRILRHKQQTGDWPNKEQVSHWAELDKPHRMDPVEAYDMASIAPMGIAGILAGPKAKTAVKAAGELAEALAKQGRSNRYIYDVTKRLYGQGWQRVGPGTQVGFEISDKGMKIRSNQIPGWGGRPLGDVVDHKELFEAYPYMADKMQIGKMYRHSGRASLNPQGAGGYGHVSLNLRKQPTNRRMWTYKGALFNDLEVPLGKKEWGLAGHRFFETPEGDAVSRLMYSQDMIDFGNRHQKFFKGDFSDFRQAGYHTPPKVRGTAKQMKAEGVTGKMSETARNNARVMLDAEIASEAAVRGPSEKHAHLLRVRRELDAVDLKDLQRGIFNERKAGVGHELQHSVDLAEGRVAGTNVAIDRRLVPSFQDADAAQKNAFDLYGHNAGEARARAVGNSIQMDDAQRARMLAMERFDRKPQSLIGQPEPELAPPGYRQPTDPDMTMAGINEGLSQSATRQSVTMVPPSEIPKKTTKMYKLMRVDGKEAYFDASGRPHTMFVDSETPVPVGKWISAKPGPKAAPTKTGKPQVKSKIGPLSYRPGFHGSAAPYAPQIGHKAPGATSPTHRRANEAWFEVEIPADGHSIYRNQGQDWMLADRMKIVRRLPEDEVVRLGRAAGTPDLPRAGERPVQGQALTTFQQTPPTSPAGRQQMLLDAYTGLGANPASPVFSQKVADNLDTLNKKIASSTSKYAAQNRAMANVPQSSELQAKLAARNKVDPEGLGFDFAKRYPEVAAPSEIIVDPKYATKSRPAGHAKAFTPKAESAEHTAMKKVMARINKDIAKGDYKPYFDVKSRGDITRADYPDTGTPTVVATLRKNLDKVGKQGDTARAAFAETEALARDPQAMAYIGEMYKKGALDPLTENWYFIKQLEKKFIDEFGPEAGRKELWDTMTAMAATTGGQSPQANFRMGHYAEYMRRHNLPAATESGMLPYPIGGSMAMSNMKVHREIMGAGGGVIDPAVHPKRFNFRENYFGNPNVGTVDEVGSRAWKNLQGVPPRSPGYGQYEQAMADATKAAGAPNARQGQEVIWHAISGKFGKPFIDDINEIVERTRRLTGLSADDVIRFGIIRKELPIAGLIAAPVGAELFKADGLLGPSPEQTAGILYDG